MLALINNITIRTKVVAVFAAIAVVAAVAGGLVLVQFAAVNDAAQQLRANESHVRLLGEIAVTSERVRAMIASYVMADDDAARAAVVPRLKALMDTRETPWRAYAQHVDEGRERELTDQLAAAWKDVLAAIE